VADLAELLKQLANAKVAETEAKNARVAIEEQIAATLADRPERGQRTIQGGVFKCTVKFDLNYKANVEAIRQLDVPLEVGLPLKQKPATWEFDETAYERLREEHPEIAAKIAPFVETKPAKPSLTLKV
jgi:hypothetical protein